ncbi:MAG: hypothetical protein IJS43_07395 [Bacteroidaceae bacterium]|nr:hypothetical protein [Bacteroidaceae bacterium]
MNTQATTTATRVNNATRSRKVTNRTNRAKRAAAKHEPKHVAEIIPEAIQEIKNTRTARQEAARQKRAELKALSKQLKQLAKMGAMPDIDGTVNGLLRFFYEQQGHTELKTFDEWKAAGYSVRKGQKAILLWGKPRKHDRDKEAATAGEFTVLQDDNKKEDFFPVCYVFSNLQVHAISETKQA